MLKKIPADRILLTPEALKTLTQYVEEMRQVKSQVESMMQALVTYYRTQSNVLGRLDSLLYNCVVENAIDRGHLVVKQSTGTRLVRAIEDNIPEETL